MTPLSAEEVFNLWSPENSPWSNWVKPTLFVALENFAQLIDDDHKNIELDWEKILQPRQAIIFDLPGSQSVRTSLQLVAMSYHPIPLFNSCLDKAMVVKAESILLHLIRGAEFLKQRPIKQNAMPAFLLDSNRLGRGQPLLPNFFDNRWIVLPQDMPSGDSLLSNGIKSVLVINNEAVSEDLCHILKRYQEKRIQVNHLNILTNNTVEFSMPQLMKFKSIWYRINVLMGFRQNSAGGFGSIIPMPSESHG